jgi:UDP-glucose 4-epimerase
MNIAIIGSNGFIGSHLIQHISQNGGHHVYLFGKNKINRLNNDLPYYQIDSLDKDEFDFIFSKIDIVYYLASATIPSSSWENPSIEIENNLIPFLSFIDNVSTLTIKKIVFVSSAGTVYGPSLQKVKEDADKNPFSPYGIIKLTIEHFLNYNKLKNGINFDIYRISNAYGEGQDTSKGLGIINTFIENIIRKGQVQIYGDGNNVRNYIYIHDVAKLLSHSINSELSKSNIYNLGSDDTITVNQLIETLKTVIPIEFKVTYLESRKSDNTIIEIDNSKLLKSISNFKFTSIQQGILQTYNFIKLQKNE